MAKEETLEEQIARLETQNTALLGEKNTLSASLEEVKTSNEVLKGEKETLTVNYNKLTEDHQALIDESTSEISRLSQELDSAKTDNSNGILTTEIGGKKYRVLGKKFNIPGHGELTVDVILKDKSLLKELVKQQVGFLVSVD